MEDSTDAGNTVQQSENRFGPRRLQPHADLINSKNKLGYAITQLVQEFIAYNDITIDQIEIVCNYGGCYVKVTL